MESYFSRAQSTWKHTILFFVCLLLFFVLMFQFLKAFKSETSINCPEATFFVILIFIKVLTLISVLFTHWIKLKL